jgi:hypothetical protein
MVEREKMSDAESDPAKLEAMMHPLRQLGALEMINASMSPESWRVSVEWSEPQEDGTWETYQREGPMGDRFLRWAEDIYRYWLPKAHINIKVKKLEYLPAAQGASGW